MKKSSNKVKVLSSHGYGDVIKGGEVSVSVEDARALYELTAMSPTRQTESLVEIPHAQLERYEAMRTYLRTISKTILMTSGPQSSLEQLMSLEVSATEEV